MMKYAEISMSQRVFFFKRIEKRTLLEAVFRFRVSGAKRWRVQRKDPSPSRRMKSRSRLTRQGASRLLLLLLLVRRGDISHRPARMPASNSSSCSFSLGAVRRRNNGHAHSRKNEVSAVVPFFLLNRLFFCLSYRTVNYDNLETVTLK